MSSKKKTALVSKQCVACGVCSKVCPLSAISIYKGLYATVTYDKCVGCGKCVNACPADCIVLTAKEVTA